MYFKKEKKIPQLDIIKRKLKKNMIDNPEKSKHIRIK